MWFALQEVTSRTLALWRAALETIGLAHVRTSLDRAEPARVPAPQRRTGVARPSTGPLRARQDFAKNAGPIHGARDGKEGGL
jgi:hypothetical protein